MSVMQEVLARIGASDQFLPSAPWLMDGLPGTRAGLSGMSRVRPERIIAQGEMMNC